MKHDVQFWKSTASGIIKDTATALPDDVKAALENARGAESAPGPRSVLGTILKNAETARRDVSPMCQDTGTLTFWVEITPEEDTQAISEGIALAVEYATFRGWLRKNVIDSVSGRQIDENHAPGNPSVHFRRSSGPHCRISLLMKGGGSENMSRQYSLPDEQLCAARDLDGVRKCILDAVWQAQGNGCAPGIAGVCIGGDRANGFESAKEQLLRPLTDHSPAPALAELENVVLEQANSLGIGPMGLGGKTTLLGVKIGAMPRLPASFFVTVAYCCWACRRKTLLIQ